MIFQDALVFLLAAALVVPLFQYMKLNPILGYLTAGVLLGPHATGLVSNTETVHTLGDLGVVLLLFTIGLELSFDKLINMRRQVVGIGGSQILLSTLVMGSVALLMGLNGGSAFVVGMALALSSTAFVMQLLSDQGSTLSRHGQIGFSVLLMQDLAVVPMLALMPLLAEPSGSPWLADLAVLLLKGVLSVFLVMVLGRALLSRYLNWVVAQRSHDLFIATVLGLILGVGVFMNTAGLSMALGAFLCGLVLSGSEHRYQIDADIRPFKGLFLGLFFIAVGLRLDLPMMAIHLWGVLALTAMVIVAKTVVMVFLCRLYGQPWSVTWRASLLLSQAGEFALVLFGAALGGGIIPAVLGQELLAVVTLTMMLTPLLARLGDTLAEWAERHESTDQKAIRAAEEALSGHVIIGGFGTTGQVLAHLLTAAGVPYLAVDIDRKLANRCRQAGHKVYAGDVSDLNFLVNAGVADARALVLTCDDGRTNRTSFVRVRKAYKNLPIISRATDEADATRLQNAGMQAAVPLELEARLQLGAVALSEIGLHERDVTRLLNAVRRTDYQVFRQVIQNPTTKLAPRRR